MDINNTIKSLENIKEFIKLGSYKQAINNIDDLIKKLSAKDVASNYIDELLNDLH